MELVIDAGIVFTALTGKGITKELIFSEFLTLFAPEYLFEEIDEHMSEILALTSFSAEEANRTLTLLKSRIRLASQETFQQFLEQANALIPDKDDTAYLALALSRRTPIWSNDEDFKEQSSVEVFNTKELVEELKARGFIAEA